MNFSISELIVILLIALLVIKPEQLPELAFVLGRFAQTVRDLFAKIRHEVDVLAGSAQKSEHKRE